MNSNQLKQFMAIAERESITEAAEYLHMTQPALSNALRRLEEELNRPLFDRTNNSIKLNEYGELLLGYAFRIDALMTLAEKEIKRTEDKNHISIATINYDYFPFFRNIDILGEFSTIKLKFSIEDKESIIKGLQSGMIDMGIIPSYDPYLRIPGIRNTMLLKEKLFVNIPQSDELSHADKVFFKDLFGKPFAKIVTQKCDDWEGELEKETGVKINYTSNIPKEIAMTYAGKAPSVFSFGLSSFLWLNRYDYRSEKDLYTLKLLADEHCTRFLYIIYKDGCSSLISDLVKKTISILK